MILYNKTQIKCIEHPPAPLMIIAGAGTGKTTTIVGRIACFIEKHNIDPKTILALTYTVKAAEHLKNEISKAVGFDHDSINALNFHSFALDQTIEHYEFLGYSIIPTLVESNESKYIISKIIADSSPDLKSSEYRKNNSLAFNIFPKIFNQLNDELIYGNELVKKYDDLLLKDNKDEEDKQLIDAIYIFFKYQKLKKENNLLDFGDMLVNLWILLNDNHKHTEITESINHVVVDEFQDNNFALTEIVKKISGKNSSITVVGDDDQSIYSFRGANNDSFNSFRDYYQASDDYQEIILTYNYRSNQSILNFAHESVKNIENRLKSKPLNSNSNDDSPVVLYEGNRIEQLHEIIDRISMYLKKGVSPSEICILTRSRSSCIEVSRALNKNSINNSYQSGKFFEDTAVKDFISFINLIENGVYRDIGLYRLLSRYSDMSSLNLTSIVRHSISYINNLNLEEEYSHIGNNRVLEWIKNNQAQIHSKNIVNIFSSFYKNACDDKINSSTYEQLNSIIDKYLTTYQSILGSSLCFYLNNLFDLNETFFNSIQSNDKTVQIMTVHQSKGMEFDYVMIPFLSSGTFPSSNKNSKLVDSLPIHWKGDDSNAYIQSDNYDEERRVFHVAITRSRKELMLFAPDKRRSKFFKEIAPESFKELEISGFEEMENTKKNDMIFSYKNLDKYSFSATSLSLYENCPLAYKYRMYDRLKLAGYSPDATFGIFVHNVLEKIYAIGNCSEDTLVGIVEEEWDESYFENSTQSNEYKEEALDMMRHYFRDNPIDQDTRYILEKELSIFLDSVEFRGKLDRIDIKSDGSIQIIDYKTSKKKKTQKSISKDIQLPYYFLLLSKSKDDEFQGAVNAAKFEYVRHSEDPSVEVSLGEEDMLQIKDRVKNISNNVQKDIFTPKKNSICYYCEFKRLLCPLYK